MTSQPTYLVDQSSVRVADLEVSLIGGFYSGTIGLSAAPPNLKHLFEEFEEMVEGQVFTVADEIEERIGRMRLKVIFADGGEAHVQDLQVYPSINRVSFKTRQTTPVRGCAASAPGTPAEA